MPWRAKARIKIEKETIDNGFGALDQAPFHEAIGEGDAFRGLRSGK